MLTILPTYLPGNPGYAIGTDVVGLGGMRNNP